MTDAGTLTGGQGSYLTLWLFTFTLEIEGMELSGYPVNSPSGRAGLIAALR